MIDLQRKFTPVQFPHIIFLSHAKIILELLLQNDKAKAFSEGEIPPQPPPP